MAAAAILPLQSGFCKCWAVAVSRHLDQYITPPVRHEWEVASKETADSATAQQRVLIPSIDAPHSETTSLRNSCPSAGGEAWCSQSSDVIVPVTIQNQQDPFQKTCGFMTSPVGCRAWTRIGIGWNARFSKWHRCRQWKQNDRRIACSPELFSGDCGPLVAALPFARMPWQRPTLPWYAPVSIAAQIEPTLRRC